MKSLTALAFSLLCVASSFAASDAVRIVGDVKVDGIHFADGSTMYTGNGLLKDKGIWLATHLYSAGDVVQSQGSSYICTTANINMMPPRASYWSVLAAQGPSGDSGTVGTITLDVLCNAIISANKVLPSYCTGPVISTISLSPKNSSANTNTAQQFTVLGTMSDKSTQDLTQLAVWNSSNTSVATISNVAGLKGTLSAVAVGTTTITATYGNFSDSTNFNTTSPVLMSISISPKNSSANTNTTQQFTVLGTMSNASIQDLTQLAVWNSSNTSVATISNVAGLKGTLSAVAVGTTSITATYGNFNDSTNVSVTAPDTSGVTGFSIPTVNGDPYGVAAGPDGNLWFTETGGEPGGNKIGRITPSGVITEFSIPTIGCSPIGLTAGPDGNLWFTEVTGNKIGRITPAGVITEFSIPTINSRPWDIAAGPDGNLWFAESSGNKIGRITPAGVITEFAIPTVKSGTYSVTAGPDGNLWFTEQVGKIGRITPDGVITEYTIPTIDSTPVYITAGPDGNLWFTENFGNKIGKITPAGVITEYALPAANSEPYGITAGPDGNLWFTEFFSYKIGRITPDGVITEYTIPTSYFGISMITVGPDGNLWFAAGGGNIIGRMSPNK
jgi:streptogramin lyase